MSSFVEEYMRKHIQLRKFQLEFIARGLASRDRAGATGRYVAKDELMDSLRSIRDEARKGR